MLASLAMLALGIFGPGIATGLVSGGPQLGAGAMAGAALGAAGTAIAVGAVATGVGGAVAAGARMAPAAARTVGGGARVARSTVGSAPSAFQVGGAGAKGQAAAGGTRANAPGRQPAWARRLHRRQQVAHAATLAAHTLRGGDGGGSSAGPSLRDPDA
jgi:type IV secretion system protein TrbL